MNLSRGSQIAEWSVAAVVVGFHLVLMTWTAWGGELGVLILSLRDSLIVTQPSLVVAWAILGPGRWWLRLTMAPVLLWLGLWWGAVPYLNLPDYDNRYFLSLTVSLIAVIGALRCCGLSMCLMGSGQVPRAQFSIRALLIATTLIAGVIAALEYLRPALAETELQRVTTFGFPGGEILLPNDTFTGTALRVIVLAMAKAAIVCGAMYTVLRPGAVWLRVSILVVAVPVLAGYLIHLINVSDTMLAQRIGELVWAFAALAGMTAATVLPLRLMGFRLLRPSNKKCGSAVPAERELATGARSPRLFDRDGRTTFPEAAT